MPLPIASFAGRCAGSHLSPARLPFLRDLKVHIMMTLRATAIGLALASLGLTAQAQPPMPDADGKPPMAQGDGKGKKPAQQNVPLAGPNGVLVWLSDQS